ncbi:MAG: methionyl-tRNA formyltransferase [Gammaproteobacteria bacterium]|nr:methionyl-tRNA formyltransferase [Gammaproteobacteria bacterium]
MTTPLKVIFAGTPEFAATHLDALINSNHQVCAVYTQPDRPAGRGRKLTASPVKQLAEANELIVCQPETLKTDDAKALLQSFKADIMVVVAYGIILPKVILEIPRLGCINVHASLLPRWRGAAPIQRAVEAGDKETGVTIIQMDEGLDTGDMLVTSKLIVASDETSSSLHNRLMKDGAKVLIEALDIIASNNILATKQNDEQACYAKKLTKEEALIDWSLSAEEIDRKIRAFYPWPGSFVSLNDQRMKVIAEPLSVNENAVNERDEYSRKIGEIITTDENGLAVKCAEGHLLIKSLQIPGKKMTAISNLLNAYQDRFQPGQQFD